MNILGIGGYGHDAAAALIQDGQLVAAVSEERLSRVKHQGGVPHRAAAWCLAQGGITRDDVDYIGCNMRPGVRLARHLSYRALSTFRNPIDSVVLAGYELARNYQYVAGVRSLCGAGTALHFMEHHVAHAASAFLCSPHEEAALLSIDFAGEWAATWTGTGHGARITRLRQANYPNSLGAFYSAITDYLGFLHTSDEYKVMGLAACGEPIYYEDLKKVVRPQEDGWYRVDHRYTAWHELPVSQRGYFSDKFIREFGPPRRRDDPLTDRHRNLAASAQKLLEDTVLAIAQDLHRKTGLPNLCVSGGVALNCAMNGRLMHEGPFENVWVQPAAGDDGTAIGAALQLHHQFVGPDRVYRMEHAYLGPVADNDEIEMCLKLTKTPYSRPANIVEDAARMLADGKIVGWYYGAMEFGPRALGNRSILADPTRPSTKDLVNKYVKFRDVFRPFAPSVLAERAPEYFENCTESPFMDQVYPVRPEKQAEVPAITHVDGTARVHTVTASTNPRFHALLKAFEALKGTPMLLNTSFNLPGKPFVHTPADALKCFYATGMDAVALGDFLVVKNP